MHPFVETISVVLAIVSGIIVLMLAFKLLAWISDKVSPSPSRIAFKGILDERTPCTVHLGSGTIYENVRLIGFIGSGGSSSPKPPIPYELNNMVILEHSDGRRTLIQAKNIRIIEVPPKVD